VCGAPKSNAFGATAAFSINAPISINLIRSKNKGKSAWIPRKESLFSLTTAIFILDLKLSLSNLPTLGAFLKMRSVEVDHLPDHFLV
jgi:hypothetical protein